MTQFRAVCAHDDLRRGADLPPIGARDTPQQPHLIMQIPRQFLGSTALRATFSLFSNYAFGRITRRRVACRTFLVLQCSIESSHHRPSTMNDAEPTALDGQSCAVEPDPRTEPKAPAVELRSWQQIIDLYGGGYQLTALCGKTFRHAPKSERLYLSGPGPARKPRGKRRSKP
ncbi:hypothetical protein [Polyangium spumosum]|uniref:Uncharacterized protein n=1 Tax=Polyangium spumosum TaxID=889282 RepID=A0A6N7PZY7_9BACT|nr:hypothetical protein [Polyangium spumosum]MRG97782.1 hypothetical protein [Polyangium spumosum]